MGEGKGGWKIKNSMIFGPFNPPARGGELYLYPQIFLPSGGEGDFTV
jgi:hypothetical protein